MQRSHCAACCSGRPLMHGLRAFLYRRAVQEAPLDSCSPDAPSARARQVCASTSVLMILFSSSAIAISLAFQGLLNVHYAVVFAPACFLGSLLGARRR